MTRPTVILDKLSCITLLFISFACVLCSCQKNPVSGGGLCWSPDGKVLAFYANKDPEIKGQEEIFVVVSEKGSLHQLTDNSFQDINPQWIEKGYRIAFYSDQNGKPGIYSMKRNGSDLRFHLGGGKVFAFSPDERKIAFVEKRGTITIIDLKKATMEIIFEAPSGIISSLSWSPDGSFISFDYEKTSSGSSKRKTIKNQIMLYETASHNIRELMDGARPVWSPDSTFLSYQHIRSVCVISLVQMGAKRRVIGRGICPAWDPQGKRVAYLDNELKSIFIVDLEDENKSRSIPLSWKK